MNDTISYRLNVIRLLAAHMVLWGHAFAMFRLTIFQSNEHFASLQRVGVVLLVFISGYLTMHSFVSKNMNFKQFAKNRFFRIYPSYIISLIFIFSVDRVWQFLNSESYAYSTAFNLKHFIGNVFLIQDFPYLTEISSFGSGRPLWTLSVEWWTYFFAAFIFYRIIPKAIERNLKWSDIAIVTLLGIIPVHNLTYGRGRVVLAWIMGCLVYLLYNRCIFRVFNSRIKNTLYHLCLKSAAVLFLLVVLWKYKNAYHELTYLAIFVVGILYLNKDEKSKCFGGKKLNRLAAYTYPLYLCHYSIFTFVRAVFDYNDVTKFIVSILLSNIVAIVIYYMVEWVRLVYKKKFISI